MMPETLPATAAPLGIACRVAMRLQQISTSSDGGTSRVNAAVLLLPSRARIPCSMPAAIAFVLSCPAISLSLLFSMIPGVYLSKRPGMPVKP